MFKASSSIYEKHREEVLHPEILIRTGFFQRERNITQAIDKNTKPGEGQYRSKSAPPMHSFNISGEVTLAPAAVGPNPL